MFSNCSWIHIRCLFYTIILIFVYSRQLILHPTTQLQLVPNCPLPAHVNRLSHRFNFATATATATATAAAAAAATHQFLIYKRNQAICICLFWCFCFVFGTSSTGKAKRAQWCESYYRHQRHKLVIIKGWKIFNNLKIVNKYINLLISD